MDECSYHTVSCPNQTYTRVIRFLSCVVTHVCAIEILSSEARAMGILSRVVTHVRAIEILSSEARAIGILYRVVAHMCVIEILSSVTHAIGILSRVFWPCDRNSIQYDLCNTNFISCIIVPTCDSISI